MSIKKRLSVIFSSIAFLFCFFTLQASPEDSLKNVIANTEGEKKLEAIANLMVLKSGGEEGIEYAIMLEEEARKQNNEEYIGNALTVKVMIYINQFNTVKFFPAAEEAKDYLMKKKQFNRYFAVCNFEIKMYLIDGYYETAFLKISSMLEETKKLNNLIGEINVYENMGDAYYIGKHNQKALEAYQRVFYLLNTHYPEFVNNRAEIGIKITENAYKIGDIPLTLLYCDSIKQVVEEFDRTKSKKLENLSSRYIKIVLYAYYALAYYSVGREMEATEAINMAFMYDKEDIFDTYRQTFYYLCSDYFFKRGEYKTALEYIEKGEKLTTAFDELNDGDFMQMKSKILAAMGNSADAYKIEREYAVLADSLNQKRLSQRISELRTLHQVEKLKFQAEQERLKAVNMRLFIAGLTVIILLLACVISIVIYNLNKIKRKNRVLYNRIQSQEALELELKRKEEELRKIVLSGDETPDDETDMLYLRLKELMKDEKNYTDPNLSRKSLASKLGTNEKYLHETIKKHLDLSFSEYITLLRLDYAREMMSKHAQELQIEDIALQSGFGTRQTFHRLFRDRYGLSPSEFSYLLKYS